MDSSIQPLPQNQLKPKYNDKVRKTGRVNNKRQSKIDWPSLKAQYMASNLKLMEFYDTIEPKLHKRYFYLRTMGWNVEKEAMKQKAFEVAQEKIGEKLAEKYSDYLRLWNGVKDQAAAILKDSIDAEGKIIALEPLKLKALASSIEIALKGERLISGESTEKIDTVGGVLHMQAVNVIEALDQNRVEIIPEIKSV